MSSEQVFVLWRCIVELNQWPPNHLKGFGEHDVAEPRFDEGSWDPHDPKVSPVDAHDDADRVRCTFLGMGIYKHAGRHAKISKLANVRHWPSATARFAQGSEFGWDLMGAKELRDAGRASLKRRKSKYCAGHCGASRLATRPHALSTSTIAGGLEQKAKPGMSETLRAEICIQGVGTTEIRPHTLVGSTSRTTRRWLESAWLRAKPTSRGEF